MKRGGRSIRVLIVEDSEDDTLLLVRELERGGYDVGWARVDTAAAMSKALATGDWDAVVSDFSMPSFSAPAALALLHGSGLDLPFIIVSGTIGEDAAVAAMKAGAHDFLTKHNLVRLVAAVERELREADERKGRQAAETSLRASEEHLRAILDNALDGILTFDPAGLIESANPAAERIFGYAVAELVGRPLQDLVFTTDASEASPDALRQPGARDLVGRRKSGQAFPMGVSVSTTQSSRQRLGIAIVRDVTEPRELEAQVRQMLKTETIGRLAGGIAHDFNNLLAVILSYASIALRGVPAGTRLRSDLDEIVQAAQRAAGLTRQLLAFSRRQVLSPQVVELGGLIADMNKLLRRLIGEDIELAIAPARDLGRVRADRGQLEQVLMNLVVNARDAMPDGGTVTVETANAEVDAERALRFGVVEGPYVRVSVIDTGIGLSPEIRAHLFEPFFTSKALGKGTGLGLATSHGIVKQAGGFIEVDSTEGHGSRFDVHLPRLAGGDVATREGRETVSGGSETVLVVEDEPALREVTVRSLRSLGYAVLEATDGKDALRVAARYPNRIDLLLSDVIMPGLGGRKLAEQLCAVRPELRVLYASGYTDRAFLKQTALESTTGFLQKPFSLADLATKVREALDEVTPVNSAREPRLSPSP